MFYLLFLFSKFGNLSSTNPNHSTVRTHEKFSPSSEKKKWLSDWVFEIIEWANRLAWRLVRGLGEISETKVLMPFCRMLLIALLASPSHKGPCRKVMSLGKTRTIMSVVGIDEPFGYCRGDEPSGFGQEDVGHVVGCGSIYRGLGPSATTPPHFSCKYTYYPRSPGPWL
jgi:hypothetical protein